MKRSSSVEMRTESRGGWDRGGRGLSEWTSEGGLKGEYLSRRRRVPARYPRGAHDSARFKRAHRANLGGTAGVLLLSHVGQGLFCCPEKAPDSGI